MTNLIFDFIEYLQIEKQYSKNTIENYQKDLLLMEKILDKRLYNICPDDIDALLLTLSKSYKQASIARKISTLKSFYRFLETEKKIDNNYVALIKSPKKTKKIPTYLTISEVCDFLDTLPTNNAIDYRNKAMFELMYATGIRVSELINLELQNVNLDEQLIIVIGKGSKERIVPINETTVTWLREYINKFRINLQVVPTNTLFLNNKGQKLTRQGFNYILNEVTLKLGFEHINPHKFRHSIATHLINNGTDIRVVQEFLGHVDISSTQIYTHVDYSKKKAAYDDYHPLSHKQKEKK